MAEEKDNVLGIQATINGQEISKGASEFISKLSQMEQAAERSANNMSAAFDALNKKITDIATTLASNRDALNKVFAQMQSFTPTNSTSAGMFAKVNEQYQEASKRQAELEGELATTNSKIIAQKEAYEKTAGALQKVTSERQNLNAVSNVTAGTSAFEEMKKQLQQLKEAILEDQEALTLLTNIPKRIAELQTKQQSVKANYTGKNDFIMSSAGQEYLKIGRQIDELQQKLSGIYGTEKELKDAIKENQDKIKGLNDELNKTPEKQVRIRTEMMNINQQLMTMKRNGEGNTEEFRKLQQKAAELKHVMLQNSKELNTFATEGTGLAVMRESIQGISGAFTATLGVMSLFTDDTEKLAKIQKDLQAAMSITMGVQQLMNLTYSTSQTRIYLVAQAQSLYASTIVATSKAFVRYGLSATAAKVATAALYSTLTMGVGLAIFAIIEAITKYVEKQKTASEITKKANEEIRDMNHESNKSIASQVGTLKKLQDQWNNLGGDLSKQKKFVQDNVSEFKKLGISVDNVNDASNVLVENTDKFIESLKKRALAAAAYNLAVKDYEEELNLDYDYENANGKVKHQFAKKGDKYVAGYTKQTRISGVIGVSYSMDVPVYKTIETDEELTKRQSELDAQYLKDVESYKKKNKESHDAKKQSLATRRDKFFAMSNTATKDADALLDEAGIKKSEKGDKTRATEAKKAKREAEQRAQALEQANQRVLEARAANYSKEVSLMKEGESKVLAQIDSEYETEKARIQKQIQDYQKLNKKSGVAVNTNRLTDEQQKVVDDAELLNDSKRLKSKKDYYDSLAKDYKDYTAKRIEIKRKYNADIASLENARNEATTNGDAVAVDKYTRAIAEATKNKGMSLMSLDFAHLKENPQYIKAFENLGDASSKTLGALMVEMERLKSEAAKTMDPKDLREYVEQIKAISDELMSRNPLKWVESSRKNLKKANENLKKSEEKLASVRAKGYKVDENGKLVIEGLTEAQNEYNKAADEQKKAQNEYTRSIEKTLTICDLLSKSFTEIGNAIGGTAGNIISVAGEVLSFTSTSVESIQKLGEKTTDAFQVIEKVSVILSLISTAYQLLNKIADLGIGDNFKEYEKYAEKVAKISKMTDAVLEYRTALIEAEYAEENWFSSDNLKNLRYYKELQVDALEKYTAKLHEIQAIYVNEGAGGWLAGMANMWKGAWNATYGNLYGDIDAYNKAVTEAKDNLRIETRKKSSGFLGIGGKSQKTSDLQSWIDANKSVFEAYGITNTDLFDSDGWVNTELAQSILDNYGDKLVGQTKDTLEALVSLKEEYDEYLDQLQEYVSSLYEPIVSSFTDSLWEWFDEGTNALKAFKDSAKSTFRDIVTDMMQTIVLDKVVGNWSDEIASLYEDYATGKTDEESLMKQVTQKVNELVASYETQLPTLQSLMTSVTDMFEAAGFDLKDTDSQSQSGSTTAWQSMTEDTAEELNGRFTALQYTGEEILLNAQQQTTLQELISTDTTAIREAVAVQNQYVSELVDIQYESVGYLADISKNTKQLYEMNEKLGKIEEYTKSLK